MYHVSCEVKKWKRRIIWGDWIKPCSLGLMGRVHEEEYDASYFFQKSSCVNIHLNTYLITSNKSNTSSITHLCMLFEKKNRWSNSCLSNPTTKQILDTETNKDLLIREQLEETLWGTLKKEVLRWRIISSPLRTDNSREAIWSHDNASNPRRKVQANDEITSLTLCPEDEVGTLEERVIHHWDLNEYPHTCLLFLALRKESPRVRTTTFNQSENSKESMAAWKLHQSR